VKEMTVTPDRAQRTIWFIHWALWFFPVMIGLLLLLVVNPIVSGICLLIWALFMVPLLFWLAAYFRSLAYSIADDALKGQKGVFWKRFVTVPYHKITNVDITQGPLQRRYNVATIHCQTAGAGGQQGGRAELKIEGVGDGEGLKEAIMERVKDSAVVGTEGPRPKAAGAPQLDTLGQVLKELQAIRQLLEKQS
jgi:membrane protein YdbS with pleckstrin-like domain